MKDEMNPNDTSQFSFVEDGAANAEEMASVQSVLDESQATVEPEPTPADVAPSYQVNETEVRAILRYGFEAGHLFTGHEHWKATEPELDAVVPGVTRLINRSTFLSTAVERVSEYSDWASLGHLFWMILRRTMASRALWAEEKAKEAEASGDVSVHRFPEPTFSTANGS